MGRVKEKIKEWLGRFEDTLFPEFGCFACGRELEHPEVKLCDECSGAIDWHDGRECPRCGAKLRPSELICDDCKGKERKFDRAMSVCEYGDVSGALIKGLKYNGRKYLAKLIARLMVNKYLGSTEVADTVTFVPQSEHKLKLRGFNHAELIATHFCELLNLPLVDTLDKVKELINQSRLSSDERATNIRGAYKLKEGINLKGKTVLLIDDVYTTGATSTECAQELLKARAKRVVVFTFAKTSLKNR